MALVDASAGLLPQHVMRNLSDKLYEKRKSAALEIQSIVHQFVGASNHQKISELIQLLIREFVYSPQTFHRQGGLFAVSSVVIGLTGEPEQHLDEMIPAVLSSCIDPDSRVRYFATESLYNIVKAVRGECIAYFNDIFDALCKLSADTDLKVQNAAHLLDRLVKDIVLESDQFSIEEFIPLLRERMQILSPLVRNFLVGWITCLDSVPDIDMLGFLPDFLDGLFNMLGDSDHEIRVQADSALGEFLQEIKHSQSVDYGRMIEILVQRAGSHEEFIRLTAVTWLYEFVKRGGRHLVPYYAAITGAILPCMADKEEKIAAVAREANEEQKGHIGPTSVAEGFDIAGMLVEIRKELLSEWETTRMEALFWLATLLDKFRPEVLSFLDDPDVLLFGVLLQSLNDESDDVVYLTLSVLCDVAKDSSNFLRLLQLLILRFNADRSLLEKRGSVIVRQLCVHLDSARVFRELAALLRSESDFDFATLMVQALNLILLTAVELSELRAVLRSTSCSREGSSLFLDLYSSWTHSPATALSLCLLAQAYGYARRILVSLEEDDITVNLLVQLDKLVQLLETPIFAYLRLQLLEPEKYPSLLMTLYGILMLLPQQSLAFAILRTRLKSVPIHPLSLSPPSHAYPLFLHTAPSLSPAAAHPPAVAGPAEEAALPQLPSPAGSAAVFTEPAEPPATAGEDKAAAVSGEVELDMEEHLLEFARVQEQHRKHRREAAKAAYRRALSRTSSALGRSEESRLGGSTRSMAASLLPSDDEAAIPPDYLSRDRRAGHRPPLSAVRARGQSR